MAKVKSEKNRENSAPLLPSSFLHGVEVVEVTESVRPVQTVNTSVIGLIGTAPDADNDIFPPNTPILIQGSLEKAELLGKSGTLFSALAGIFAQGGAEVIVVRVSEGESEADTLNHIIGGIDPDTDHYTGVRAFLASQSRLSRTPRLLIAPHFTHQRPNSDPNPVIKALLPVAEQLRAVMIADGPDTTDRAVIDWRHDWQSPRVFVVDPWVIPDGAWHEAANKTGNQTDGKRTAVPPSPFVAGLIAKVDHEQGFWVSPSNQVIQGIAGLSRPVDFAAGYHDSRASQLNHAEVTTIIHQGGYRLWGNRTCSGDSRWAFLSVRRTADMLHESLVRAHQWAIDRNITRTYASEVTESVNAYLAKLISQGAILAGNCTPDSEHNTPDAIASGEIRFQLSFTPPYPAERIGFRSQLLPMGNTLAEKSH
nr:bacteriophage protein [Coxiellaceae bacterium]